MKTDNRAPALMLTPAEKIPLQSWMICEETQAVLSALRGEGRREKNTSAAPAALAPAALFVGGSVRNALLGQAVEDIDIATPHLPEMVMALLEGQGIKAIPTGIDHGTVTAVLNGRHFEITTLRKDVSTDGRRAVVAYTDDWAQDAARRDFTMNTLLADDTGQIFDPLGCGLDDLRARKITFVGQADARIKEDYLRILRYFRFHAQYGFALSAEAADFKACTENADGLARLSKERITQEFFKILAADNSAEILRVMLAHQILPAFAPLATHMTLLKDVCNFQKNYGLISLSARLYVLGGCAAANHSPLPPPILETLLIPKVFQKDAATYQQALSMDDMAEPRTVRRVLYRCGRMAAAQVLMISLAQDRVMNGYVPKALEIIQNWDIPDCPVSGEDMIKAGIPSGPQIGDILERLEQHWIESDFTLSKDRLMSML
ncbi:MAG: CCA tRNA nucleotidyltransferase [Alphaproteobacteria bacterium]